MAVSSHQPRILPLRAIFRWFTPLGGGLLTGLGCFFVSRPAASEVATSTLGSRINEGLHLGMPAIDTVLLGIAFLLAGVSLLLVFFRNVSPSGNVPFARQPGRQNLFRSLWVQSLVGLGIFIWLLIRLHGLDDTPLLPWLWLLSLALIASTFLHWDLQNRVALRPFLTRPDWLWLLGLLIIGLLLTAYRLQGWPDQLMGDEGIFGSTARDVATGTFQPPLFSQGVDTFPVLSTIWQGLVMRFFGINIWGWRFASVLPGVLTVIPLYLLSRAAFNRRVAVLASLVLLTNPYFLVYARLGYTNIQPVFLVTLTLCLLYAALRRGSRFLLFLSGCTAGLGFYTYFSGRSALVIALAFLLLMGLVRQLRFKNLLATIFLFLAGVALVAAPHIVYGISQNAESMSYRLFLSFFNSVAYGGAYYPPEELVKYAPLFRWGGTELFFNLKIYLVFILRGYLQTLLPFLRPGMLWGDHYLACPLAGTFGAFFLVIGLAFSLRQIRQPRFLLFLLWFFIVITILSALNTFPPREDHMVPVVPAMALLIGLGLDAFTTLLVSVSAWLKAQRIFLLALPLVLVMGSGMVDYFVTAPRDFPQRAEDLLSWAVLDSGGESFLYVYDEAPLRPDFIPWMVFELLPDVEYHAYTLADLLEDPAALDNERGVILFYHAELGPALLPFLQDQWGADLRTQTFPVMVGQPALLAAMNVPFTFERERPFFSTLLDSFRHPGYVLLLAVLLACFLLAVLLPVKKKTPSNPPASPGDPTFPQI